ncbi:MAG TPA: metallophosphoesterase, partial [Bacteroidota bacterium]|nr:metallophosphoesterase [Bacteroidota bacterium]
LSSRPGIFDLNESCKVALVGDWGSGIENAYRVMQNIRHRQKPNMTIHLGDIYYSGQVDEVNNYFLGQDDWYRAERSFALNGNHEMYSGGTGYFEHVLPALRQETSYFCIENRFWRIVGLDTGYNSKVFPFLDLFMGTSFPVEILRWLRKVVFPDREDNRPVILLTHHQWFSAFDRGYVRIGMQLRPYLHKVALWFWGHEHRFAGYAPFAPHGRVKVRARCIGHGGMPVEIEKPTHLQVPAVFVDNRVSDQKEDPPIGYCGNALLEFEGPRLLIRYFDELENELLVEEWQSGGKSGGVNGRIKEGSQKLTWLRHKEYLVQ